MILDRHRLLIAGIFVILTIASWQFGAVAISNAQGNGHVDKTRVGSEHTGDFPANRKFDGVNLLPLLTEGKSLLTEGQVTRTASIVLGHGKSRAMRDGSWKLVMNAPGQKQPGLFDLAEDMGEQADLAKQEPGRLKKMLAAIEAWE